MERYDLILLDSQLSDGSGRDFMSYYTTLVESKRAKKSAEVVGISGNSVQDQETVYSGCHMHGFLQKPVSKAKILEVLRSLR